MRHQPSLRVQIVIIWVLAVVAEVVVLVRLLRRLELAAAGAVVPPGAVGILWNVLALVAIPAAAFVLTRALRREQDKTGRDHDRTA